MHGVRRHRPCMGRTSSRRTPGDGRRGSSGLLRWLAGEKTTMRRNFVVFAMAFAGLAAYGEPINLGCSARGPLAALRSSAEFREAFGSANPANFLGGVYDVNGVRLSPLSSRALQCPLFIDSDATPSASASKAILSAEANLRAPRPNPQTTAPTPIESSTLVVESASGVVAEIPVPVVANPAAQAAVSASPSPEPRGIRSRRAIEAASKLTVSKERTLSEVAKSAPEPPVQAQVLQAPSRVDAPRAQITPAIQAPQVDEELVLSLGLKLGLIRKVERPFGQTALEFNPLMMVLYFLALFVVAGAAALLFWSPRYPTAAVRRRLDPLETVFRRFESPDGLPIRGSVPAMRAPRPVPASRRHAAPSLVPGD